MNNTINVKGYSYRGGNTCNVAYADFNLCDIKM